MSGELPFCFAAILTLGAAGVVALIWVMVAFVLTDVVRAWKGREWWK